MYCLNFVKTKKDENAERGAKVTALALCSKYNYFCMFKSLMRAAMDLIEKNEDDSSTDKVMNIMNKLFVTINSIKLTNKLTELQVSY